MKKVEKLIVMAVLLLAGIAFCGAASAESKITVSFAPDNLPVNGGFSAVITLKLKQAAQRDLEIPLTCKETGESLQVRIPAGSLEGTAEYQTQAVNKIENRTFSAEDGDGYTVRNKCALRVLPLPKAVFAASLNFGYVGKDSSVAITFKNPAYVVRGSTFQLRDQYGNVLAEKTWNSGDGRRTFQVPVTPQITGKRMLSVWLNGVKVSEQDGYAAFTDMARHAVRQVETDQPLVAITLDCGWYGQQMPDILPILKKNDVHCTFFMTGFFIRTFTKEAQDALNDGHEIGNHSNSHPKMAEQKAKINRVSQLTVPIKNAKELLGVTPRLFRPPYGDYDKELMALCRAEGMEIIIWTVDSHDWDDQNGYTDPEKVWKRVAKKIEPGYIFLFHLDGKATPTVLERLIPYIQDELGYKCVTVSELLAAGGLDLPPLPDDGADMWMEEDPNEDVMPENPDRG